MKQTAKALIGLILIVFLGGCSTANKTEQKKTEEAQNQEQTQDTGYLRGMVGIKNQAEKNIQNSTDAENRRLEETLNEDNKSNTNNMDYVKKYSGAVLNTNLGKIKVKFYNEESPVTVNNFLKLASEKFYNGTKFHRVIKNFMIQGGDPNSKDSDWTNDGQGGPGYKFNDELKGTEKYTQGTLAMANSGPNTNGSQFFIVTASPGYPLPPSYTVFGQVDSGMDVALKIENVKTNANDHPTEDVVIQSVELISK
jgi:cyclophilin family peptidyl-prolyl cis-trans isomerase